MNTLTYLKEYLSKIIVIFLSEDSFSVCTSKNRWCPTTDDLLGYHYSLEWTIGLKYWTKLFSFLDDLAIF